ASPANSTMQADFTQVIEEKNFFGSNSLFAGFRNGSPGAGKQPESFAENGLVQFVVEARGRHDSCAK
ncbi:MAG: hypothetical protein OXH27_01330, partial [Gammaproteobacteria bacterium]|nr:hypothetical protein [Gammaproteobacteria bacterium]